MNKNEYLETNRILLTDIDVAEIGFSNLLLNNKFENAKGLPAWKICLPIITNKQKLGKIDISIFRYDCSSSPDFEAGTSSKPLPRTVLI